MKTLKTASLGSNFTGFYKKRVRANSHVSNNKMSNVFVDFYPSETVVSRKLSTKGI